MNLKGLAVAALLSVGAAASMWLLYSGGAAPEETPSGPATPERASPAPTSVTGPEPVPARLYAVEVEEGGLPRSTPPGSQLELWVVWDRPDPRRPRVEKLLPAVTLDETVPAFTPGGPYAAMLRVEVSQIPKLIQAERHGTLEISLPSATPVE